MTTETRNSNIEMKDMNSSPDSDLEGVGGRQELGDTLSRGGGYLDVCTKTARSIYDKMLIDSRIDELKAHGLADIWIEVAEAIGYDDFIYIWQILDKKNIEMSHRDNARIRIPIFSKFLKFQRNKYIFHLSEKNETPESIQKILKRDLCENLTIHHIIRIIGKANIK